MALVADRLPQGCGHSDQVLLRQGKRIGNCYVAKQLQLVGCAGCVDGRLAKSPAGRLKKSVTAAIEGYVGSGEVKAEYACRRSYPQSRCC